MSRPIEPETTDPLLDRAGRLLRDAAPGEVSPERHRAGKAALLAALEHRPAATHAARAGRRFSRLAFATLAACALALVLLFARPSARVTVVHVDGGEIAAGGYVAPAPGSATAVRFSDGSAVTLREGGRGRIAELREHGARVVLERGTADVEVAKRPRTAWSIEAGPFVIAVTGTAFEVAWSAEQQILSVHMREGTVLVHGPMTPDGVALTAGQRLTARVGEGDLRIEAEPTSSTAGAAAGALPSHGAPALTNLTSPLTTDASRDATAGTPASTPSTPSTPRGPARAASPGASSRTPAPSTWASRIAAGDFASILADAEARGLDATVQQASLADLIVLADAARYARRSDIAQRALTAQRTRFQGTAQAATAAFLLGRIADDAHASPAAAIALYDQYLREAPGGAFAAEALGRKMVALQRSAGSGAAIPAAQAYLRLYPEGPHATAARTITASRDEDDPGQDRQSESASTAPPPSATPTSPAPRAPGAPPASSSSAPSAPSAPAVPSASSGPPLPPTP
ncbi:FecR domain-containing protein [Chondromyces apiculatus]|uniref:FecR protein domain-containing protein n=1 Tax=Chondromyces apiculatus DSM 436 TaxID=1192034 RepID=A0A017TGM2_9BACT|nr:FecR family protein [Chondromyces apiculatus]EYF07756.1 Hypothetical protein CAP_8257 [Chondromyces apiculatus DSM 436]